MFATGTTNNASMGHLTPFLITGFLTTFCALQGSPNAAVACGDTITGRAVLTEDLTCFTQPALTLQGPANLDLKGYTITCGTSGLSGIFVMGKGARLSSGTISGCLRGVWLMGQGHHSVHRLHIEGANSGFLVNPGSIKNRFIQNSAEDNAVGFNINGDDAVLTQNEANGNGAVGVITGAKGVRIIGNIFNDNNIGIELSSIGNLVINNTANDDFLNGIRVNGQGHRVQFNEANNNGLGILVPLDATDNRIIRNEARGSTIFGDLTDYNEDCDANIWRNNMFNTANQECIE